MTNKTRKQDLYIFWLLLLAVLLAVCAIWYFTDLIVTWLGAPTAPDKRGQFGDMYGSINTLFSGLAFAFLIANTYMQSRQLRMQQEELALTRIEIAAQLNQMKEQSIIFQNQVNDSILFKLIDSLQSQASLVQGHVTHYSFDVEGDEYQNYEKASGPDGFNLMKRNIQLNLMNVGRSKKINAEIFIKNLRGDYYSSVVNTNSINTYLLILKEIIKIATSYNEGQLSLLKALLSESERFVILITLFIKEELEIIKILHKNDFFHDINGYYHTIYRVICIKDGQPDPGPLK